MWRSAQIINIQFNTLSQGSSNCGSRANASLPSVIVNKVLLEYSNTHHLQPVIAASELQWQSWVVKTDAYDSRILRYFLDDPLQKKYLWILVLSHCEHSYRTGLEIERTWCPEGPHVLLLDHCSFSYLMTTPLYFSRSGLVLPVLKLTWMQLYCMRALPSQFRCYAEV